MADLLLCQPGALVDNRFRLLDHTGEGTFSNVYTCLDITSHSRVIVKACRCKRSYIEAAQDEIKVMQRLGHLDPDHRFFVHYFGHFVHKDHVCLIFERLGPSLFSILELHRYKPFSGDVVRSFMWQLVNAVDLLHANRMVHTDLKLENILLTGNAIDRDGHDLHSGRRETGIRLIDFGSSDTGSAWHRHLATTRHYRAPEILMGLRWGYECDVWSLGCMLVELAVGTIEFDARDVAEHLYLIQELIHPIPRKMWDECATQDLREFAVDGCIRGAKLPAHVLEDARRKSSIFQSLKFDADIADLALLMLNPNPEMRPKTPDILNHPMFRHYR
jgi:dual-specificity kinase